MAEDAGRTAANVADRRIGHRVADLMGDELASALHKRNGIAGVVTDESAVGIECEADVRSSIRILQILPVKMLERPRSMKTARKEVENRRLVTRFVRAGDEPIVSGHASVPPSGSRERPSVVRRGAWR